MLLLTLFPQPVLSILHYLYLILWDTAKMQPSEFLKVKVAQSCLTLCDPMDYIVHRILQARILEWVNFPFSRGSSQTRDRTQVSCIAGRFFTSEPQGKPKNTGVGSLSLLQQIFPTQESNQGHLNCRQILYQLSFSNSLPIYLLLSYYSASFILLVLSASAQVLPTSSKPVKGQWSSFSPLSYGFQYNALHGIDLWSRLSRGFQEGSMEVCSIESPAPLCLQVLLLRLS